jgi:hypothetical protein
MLEAGEARYWKAIDGLLRELLAGGGYVEADDLSLYHITGSVEEAVEHIRSFYRVYNSQRYVGGNLILRLNSAVDDATIAALNSEFSAILRGPIERTEASPIEKQDDDLPDLPRLRVPFDRIHFAQLRVLIDRLNATRAG